MPTYPSARTVVYSVDWGAAFGQRADAHRQHDCQHRDLRAHGSYHRPSSLAQPRRTGQRTKAQGCRSEPCMTEKTDGRARAQLGDYSVPTAREESTAVFRTIG